MTFATKILQECTPPLFKDIFVPLVFKESEIFWNVGEEFLCSMDGFLVFTMEKFRSFVVENEGFEYVISSHSHLTLEECYYLKILVL